MIIITKNNAARPPPSTIACATKVVTQVLISCSTFLGGTMFVSIACCILTKCYATRYYLHHSWLALIVSFEPSHDLHTCESGASPPEPDHHHWLQHPRKSVGSRKELLTHLLFRP